MEEDRIKSINGLVYDSENKGYVIDPRYKKKTYERKVKGLGMTLEPGKNNVSFISIWEKYLDNLEKKKTGKNKKITIIETSNSKSISISHSDEFGSSGISESY